MSRLRLIAGPNGAGKTTLTRTLVEERLSLGQYLNPDDIAKHIELSKLLEKTAEITGGLPPDLTGMTGDYEEIFSVLAAQQIAVGLRADWRDLKLSLTYESVMSHTSHLDFVREAKQLGFKTYLYYICTSSPELNIKRVDTRVQANGHGVPENKIVERYHRSLGLVKEMASLCDRAYFFDNSGLTQTHFAEKTPDGYLDIFEKQFDACQPAWFVAHLMNKWDKERIRSASF